MTVIQLGLFILTLSLSSCVSSLFKEAPPSFSDQIILPILSAEFKSQNFSTYPTWKNKNTSNVISVVSECSDQNVNLKTMHSFITNAIENENLIEEKKVSFKNRSGYFRKVTGLVDDHNIEVRSISFKNKNCIYLTSLSGAPEKIGSDLYTWDTFNQNIEFKK